MRARRMYGAAGLAMVVAAGALVAPASGVTAPNTPPVCANQSVTASTYEGTGIDLTCTDANGNTLGYTILSGPSHGSLSGGAPFPVYRPNPLDYTGPDSFTYKANDGTADSNTATVSITVVPQCSDTHDNDINGHVDYPQDLGCSSPSDPIEDSSVTCPGTVSASGGGANDTFIGDDDPELMFGGGGNDFIAGQGGDDCLFGQTGDDVVLGGDGADQIDGGPGADRLEGETGADEIYGGAGGDAIEGGDGADLINGEAGADTINAGAGNDRVTARDGRKDSIDCGRGNADVAIVDPVDSVSSCENVILP